MPVRIEDVCGIISWFIMIAISRSTVAASAASDRPLISSLYNLLPGGLEANVQMGFGGLPLGDKKRSDAAHLNTKLSGTYVKKRHLCPNRCEDWSVKRVGCGYVANREFDMIEHTQLLKTNGTHLKQGHVLTDLNSAVKIASTYSRSEAKAVTSIG